MADDPIESHFAARRAEDERRSALGARMAGIALTAGAVMLDLQEGIPALMGKALDLVNDHLASRDVRALSDRFGSVEERVRAAEALTPRGRRVTGDRLQLLDLTLRTELSALWALLNVDDAIAELGWTPAQFAKAAEELEYLGLVVADGNAGHASGYSRARLMPAAVLQAGPTLLPEVDWEDEIARILAILQREDDAGRYAGGMEVREEAGIPIARFDHIVVALDHLGIIEGSGPGTDAGGSFYDLTLTAQGRRVLRGDDPVL